MVYIEHGHGSISFSTYAAVVLCHVVKISYLYSTATVLKAIIMIAKTKNAIISQILQIKSSLLFQSLLFQDQKRDLHSLES